MAKEKIQSAGGIGESKIFCAPEEPGKQRMSRIETCHINGVLVSEMHLDPQVLAALDYWSSDEGIAERNANPMAREPSGVTLGADPFAKSLEQKRDDIKERGYDSYEARDPLREVADQYAQPGMRPKFLSKKKTDEGGNRDFEIVKQPNGDPVKVHGMLLGHIPERVAEARNKHFQERGNQQLRQLTEKYKEEGGATAVTDQ